MIGRKLAVEFGADVTALAPQEPEDQSCLAHGVHAPIHLSVSELSLVKERIFGPTELLLVFAVDLQGSRTE